MPGIFILEIQVCNYQINVAYSTTLSQLLVTLKVVSFTYAFNVDSYKRSII